MTLFDSILEDLILSPKQMVVLYNFHLILEQK